MAVQIQRGIVRHIAGDGVSRNGVVHSQLQDAGGNGRAAGVVIIGIAQDQNARPGRDQAGERVNPVSQVGDRFANEGRARGVDGGVGGEGNAAVGVGERAAYGIPQLSAREEGDLARVESGRVSRQAVEPIQLEAPGAGAASQEMPTARETGVGAGVSNVIIGVICEIGQNHTVPAQ